MKILYAFKVTFLLTSRYNNELCVPFTLEGLRTEVAHEKEGPACLLATSKFRIDQRLLLFNSLCLIKFLEGTNFM